MRNAFLEKKLELVNEQKSPLFRIMSIYNDKDPQRRLFGNNISAFHIGKGYILSVAHNLRSLDFPKSINDKVFNKILRTLDENQKNIIRSIFLFDSASQKWHLNIADPNAIQQMANIFKQCSYDFRWISHYKTNLCKPFLIIQFRNKNFFDDSSMTINFNQNHIFKENDLSRYTFLVELELVKAFYEKDIAVYKIVNTPKKIIDKIPFLELDFNLYDKNKNYFCLQSAPLDNLGRLLNDAQIEGFLDTFSIFGDKIGGNYILEGLRYLIKGYFRFGSSGAPYLVYDEKSEKFKANSIQSEASPIQLAINNNRNGNYQYTNGIASPLKNVKIYLERLL